MSNNEKTIWDFFMSLIKNPYGVSGLMGNLYAESGLNPKNLQGSGNKKYDLTDSEYTNKVDDGSISKSKFCNDGYGYGIAQWTYHTRKSNLYNYCKVTKNTSIGDLQAQLEFLWNEINFYTSVIKTLRNATSIQQASDIVLTKYEKPANQGDSAKKKRAGYGQAIYDRQMKPKKEANVQSAIVIKKTLRKGDKNGEVKDLQKLLIAHGYDLGKYGADGSFGDKTEAAVKKFQKDNQLVIDGVVGKKTWSKLLA